MKQKILPKTSFTFEETAKELGFASSGALSNHLFRANIHVMRDRLLPTDGKKHRMFSLSLVEKLKAAGHKHKSRMTPKVKKAIREAFLGPKEKPVVENGDTPPLWPRKHNAISFCRAEVQSSLCHPARHPRPGGGGQQLARRGTDAGGGF